MNCWDLLGNFTFCIHAKGILFCWELLLLMLSATLVQIVHDLKRDAH